MTDKEDQHDVSAAAPPRRLPKGVVLGPDGKPCRTCTDIGSWRAMIKSKSSASSSSSSQTSSASTTTSPEEPPSDCPVDVTVLGRSTWTLLHTLAANYPERATSTHQFQAQQFIRSFAQLYPCWVCATDFQAWMATPGNEVRTGGQDELGDWMCRAHNEVNRKLGKEEFDCRRWKERWKDGWKDGRCDG